MLRKVYVENAILIKSRLNIEIMKDLKGIPKAFVEKEKLTELYIDKQMSLSDIGKLAGCTRQTVYRYIKKFGMDLRNKAEARTIALDKGKCKYSRINDYGEIEEKLETKFILMKISFLNGQTKWLMS